jgi:hypothetical protein
MTLASPSHGSTVEVHECLITYFHGHQSSPEILSIQAISLRIWFLGNDQHMVLPGRELVKY